ncbi:MAG TPA: gentisate 1,2-dioxygenase [Gammaproteobacteria bacterium]|jgi:gentisate 1,2-dioxygenase|nr:gentisate 1,2-dioxygenase [Gammaproteobacteria bacterium]
MKNLSDPQPLLVDRTGEALSSGPISQLNPANDWPPVTITGEMINQEIERLADLPRPANGRRQVMFTHPSAPNPGRGLTPGVQVTLEVLKPGEETTPIRHNSTQVNFCILGEGEVVVDDRSIAYSRYDVWNHPSYAIYRHRNNSSKLHARLTYSNAALLEMMRVHLVDEDPPLQSSVKGANTEPEPKAGITPPVKQIGDDGASLMPYETLINPPSVESNTLHWPWQTVKANLDELGELGSSYVGRRLYLLFNPLTQRFNGTTPNFFATITIRPPGITDKPHRHVSSAINYYFKGSGYSHVGGKRYDWKAGDLMVSAPGWAVHNHASDDGDPVYELTVQDQPLNIYMESLLWQEDLAEPGKILGAHQGFTTNLKKFTG